MLPISPRLERVRRTWNHLLIRELSGQHQPLLADIDQHIQFEGRGSAIVKKNKEPNLSDRQTISAEIEIQRMSLDEFNEQFLFDKLSTIAQQFSRGLSDQLFSAVEQGTKEVGNVVDAKGKPLSEALILEAFEKMDHIFSPDGSWVPPTVVTSQETLEALEAEFRSDDAKRREFEEKLGRILETKRDEYRSREADRILVG